jgi:hypothetical protein
VQRAAWRDAPPLTPTVTPTAPIAPLDTFTGSLATAQNPSFLQPLAHAVDPAGPGGLVEGLAAPVAPHPVSPMSDLPVVSRSASRPAVVQRLLAPWHKATPAGTGAAPTPAGTGATPTATAAAHAASSPAPPASWGSGSAARESSSVQLPTAAGSLPAASSEPGASAPAFLPETLPSAAGWPTDLPLQRLAAASAAPLRTSLTTAPAQDVATHRPVVAGGNGRVVAARSVDPTSAEPDGADPAQTQVPTEDHPGAQAPLVGSHVTAEEPSVIADHAPAAGEFTGSSAAPATTPTGSTWTPSAGTPATVGAPASLSAVQRSTTAPPTPRPLGLGAPLVPGPPRSTEPAARPTAPHRAQPGSTVQRTEGHVSGASSPTAPAVPTVMRAAATGAGRPVGLGAPLTSVPAPIGRSADATPAPSHHPELPAVQRHAAGPATGDDHAGRAPGGDNPAEAPTLGSTPPVPETHVPIGPATVPAMGSDPAAAAAAGTSPAQPATPAAVIGAPIGTAMPQLQRVAADPAGSPPSADLLLPPSARPSLPTGRAAAAGSGPDVNAVALQRSSEGDYEAAPITVEPAPLLGTVPMSVLHTDHAARAFTPTGPPAPQRPAAPTAQRSVTTAAASTGALPSGSSPTGPSPVGRAAVQRASTGLPTLQTAATPPGSTGFTAQQMSFDRMFTPGQAAVASGAAFDDGNGSVVFRAPTADAGSSFGAPVPVQRFGLPSASSLLGSAGHYADTARGYADSAKEAATGYARTGAGYVDAAKQAGSGYVDAARQAAGGYADTARNLVGAGGSAARHAVEDATDTARSAAGGAMDQVTSLAHGAAGTATEAAHDAGAAASGAAGQLGSAAAGAAGTAAGAVTGAAGAAAGALPTDLDELARRLFDPLNARLKSALWLDRERAGMVTDLRR